MNNVCINFGESWQGQSGSTAHGKRALKWLPRLGLSETIVWSPPWQRLAGAITKSPRGDAEPASDGGLMRGTANDPTGDFFYICGGVLLAFAASAMIRAAGLRRQRLNQS